MKAKSLKPGDTFRVVGHTDPEADYRVCRTNSFMHGLRFGFHNKPEYWCYMGEDVEVEPVYVYTTMPRAKLEALVWKHTHKDYKGKREDGTKVVLMNRGANGTCSEPLSALSEEELLDKLPAKIRATVPVKVGS